jgi:hypothetical protein
VRGSGSAVGSTVDRGGTNKRAWRRLAGARRAGARACRCSPWAVEEGRRDGGKEWRRLELSVRAKEGAKELGREGKKEW